MITFLKIRDFAIFESLELSFDSGLSVFTGESGAGKSLIFDALTSVFGGRCSTANIRQGKEKYSIQVSVSVRENQKAKDYLSNQGFLWSGDEIILTKELMRDGKARVKIGDSLASTTHLREFGRTLAEIHSQNEQLFLLEKNHQLEFLDRFGNLETLKFKFKQALKQFRHWKQKLTDLEENKKFLTKRKEVLEYEIEEIDTLSLKEGEDETLETEERLLASGEKLSENYRYILEELSEKETSILKTFPSLLSAMQKVSHLLPEKKSFYEEWEDVYDKLKNLKSVVREEEEELFFSPERLEMVQSRLQSISRLKKKYQMSIPEILQSLEDKKAELESWKAEEGDEDFLRIKKDQTMSEMKELGFTLSKARRNIISTFEEQIQRELHDLGLEGGKLQVVLRWEENPEGEVEEGAKSYYLSETGLDQIEFYFSANPGEKPRPLRKVASGGELSRVMLALRSALGKQAPSQQILLLDEVDTGLGGEAANSLAKKLKKLSLNSQILLITHTQQVAAMGDHQIRIEKFIESGRTVAKAETLNFEDRKKELARMIGGKQVTQAVLKAATDLLQKKAV